MYQPAYSQQGARPGPDIVLILIAMNVAIFFLDKLNLGWETKVFLNFALWPPAPVFPSFQPWQLLSYGFLHDDLMHLMFNMFVLWMFGRELQVLMGWKRFLTYYLVCIVGAGLVQLIVVSIQGSLYPTIGASGGVYGLLLAFGLIFPNRRIMLIFPPIPMKAKYMVLIFGAVELYLGLSGMAPRIANFAHLGGMLFGFLLLRHWSGLRRGQ